MRRSADSLHSERSRAQIGRWRDIRTFFDTEPERRGRVSALHRRGDQTAAAIVNTRVA